MQTVSSPFTARTDAAVRPLKKVVQISFLKDFDPDVELFEIGVSTIGGGDILKGTSSVVQEWDKYHYEDYSDRVLQVEYERSTEPPTNAITLATADIVMDNHDDIFTPGNVNSPLVDYLKPKRPVRIHIGFGDETIPVFVGLTADRPVIDERKKTATFHCIDFMRAILDKPLDEELIYVDLRTDEIISGLLQSAGLLTSQFDLDVGTVVVPFAYFKKGSKLGEGLREISEAELGNVSMAENGRIAFQNRTNWADNTSVWTFDKRNTLERSNDGGEIINVVEVFSQARSVRENQKLYGSDNAYVVPFDDNTDTIAPGETKNITIDFRDDFGELPVVSIDDPEYFTNESTSWFRTNTIRDGSGDEHAGDVDLTDSFLFSTALQLEFTNTGSFPLYITGLEVWGAPARVASDIYIREVDNASVGTFDGYEEQVYTIKNNFIQDAVAATSIAKIILEDKSEDQDQQSLFVKGVPQLQISDVITYQDENADDDYFVTGIGGILNDSGFRQQLRVSKRVINSYFRIGISSIGGSDPLAP